MLFRQIGPDWAWVFQIPLEWSRLVMSCLPLLCFAYVPVFLFNSLSFQAGQNTSFIILFLYNIGAPQILCIYSKFQKLYFQRISILGEHNWYIEDTMGFKKSSSKNIGMTPPGFWTREGLPSQSLKSIEVTKNIRRKISAQRFPCFISRSKKKVKMFYIFYFFAI